MGPSRNVLSKPLIAVAGYAVAGGLELALLADLRVAEESAIFGVFCRRWGVPLIDGGTVRLLRIVGHGYMIPNVFRRVLDIFLAFKCPGGGSLPSQLNKLVSDCLGLNRERLAALERLA